jgi:fatty acid amide hydrolase
MLREAGAVIVGRTNVSQLLLYHESKNPLFGQTNNPFSAAHGPGGSSGGEAAAIAAGMSCVGIGTDIGGSIRGPAHVCGIAGLKPTIDRWSVQGSHTALPGQEAIRGQTGPMGRTVGDITMLMSALDAKRMSALDGRVPPLEWEDPARIDVPRLRVGFYTDDGVLAASPAVARAVHRACDALRSAGCEVVPFTPPNALDMIFTYAAAMSADAGSTGTATIGKGEVDPTLAALLRIARLPDAVRNTIAGVLAMRGDTVAAGILRSLGRKSVEALWAITAKIRAYRFTYEAALDAAGIDIVLCPPHATPAIPHGASKDFAFAGSYSMLYNVLQFPAGVVPITTVRADETHRSHARQRMEKMAADVDRQSKGLPVGVQVIARPWAESTVLAAMTEIERSVRTDDGFPVTPVP